MLLVTGNPANLIVEQAAALNYVEYLKFMAMPTIITGIALFAILAVMFRTELAMKWTKDQQSGQWTDLVNAPKFAVFCAVRLFAACIGIPIVGQIQENRPDLKEYPLDMLIVIVIAAFSLIVDLLVFDIPSLAKDYTLSTGKSSLNELHQSLIDSEANGLTRLDAIREMPSVELSGVGIQSTMKSEATSTMISSVPLAEIAEQNTRVIHETFGTFDSNALLFEKMRHKMHTFAFDALWECPWKCPYTHSVCDSLTLSLCL